MEAVQDWVRAIRGDIHERAQPHRAIRFPQRSRNGQHEQDGDRKRPRFRCENQCTADEYRDGAGSSLRLEIKCFLDL